MHIHHLNCGCMCPLGGAFYDGFSKGLTAHLTCHCLLLETDRHGLVLVDTGFGSEDMAQPQHRLASFFRVLNNIRYRQQDTALSQIRQLGFSPSDVQHIVLTHLDFDHAGGLSDFPQAQVHVLQREADAARDRRHWLNRGRYRDVQWAQVRQWHFYQPGGEGWHGFDAVRGLTGLPPEVLLIPLAGHTLGHAGVAIQTGQEWLLHAGDAYFYRDEVGQPKRHCTPGLRFYQWMMEADRQARRHNQQRLRALSCDPAAGVTMFCSHDAKELERLASDQVQAAQQR
ncbi:MBL fold metallo-hydrolase [Chimaeribacter coloradensis]|uniref:MBL fold metallo-hydrolase n=1 Tax=Chimaeribacter coloradensis TaxID=2060068 RepID=A0A2N5E2L5_9GAMM|nr:MBL fold metallo-hydrolase [Chimaeribacter coloradensis]PLR34836.1 MBL fold metallo-hydrolase [Chimaeribacter coloradensis]